MPSHSETRILPYTSEQLFNLVMDIEKYPEFLPWCIGARINETSKTDLHADVIVGYKVFRERFTSRVHFKKNKEIEVEYLKGPMRHLYNEWKFKDLPGDKCEVQFKVDFSLQAKIFEVIVEQFFQKALMKMIDAFEKRAADLYH